MKKSIILKIILVLVLVIPFSLADEKSDQVDALFSEWNRTDSPGAAIAIIKDGKIIYSRGYGMANLEHGITIKPETVFYIGSTAKQFVASCIALLVLDGKIKLDEPITTYLPSLPDLYHKVTVRQMVHHMSGIRDYLSLRHSFGTWNDHSTPEQIMQLIARQKALNFPSGELYMYSNSGYFLLAEIIGSVSGKSLAQFSKERLFDPLGMINTHFHDDYTQVVKNRAMGHVKGDNGFSQYVTTFDIVGSGGLYTTVEDLYLWDQMFYNLKLGTEFLDLIHTPGKLNNGEELDYAFGLRIDTYKGLKRVSHGGSYIGYKADLMRFPEQKFSVTVLSNLASFNPSARCREIADIYLAKEFVQEESQAKPAESPRAVTLSEEQQKHFIGTYWIEQDHAIVKIYLKESALTVDHFGNTFELIPISNSSVVFKTIPRLQYSLAGGRENPGDNLSFSSNGTVLFNASKVQSYNPSDSDFVEYLGTYFSEEVDLTLQLTLKEGKILPLFRNSPDETLTPLLKDKFRGKNSYIEFHRDSRGSLTHFTIDTGRANGILFVRQ